LAVLLSRSKLYNLLGIIGVRIAQLVLPGIGVVAAASMKALATTWQMVSGAVQRWEL